MDIPMDKEIGLLQQKLSDAQMRVRSIEIDLEILRKNPYAAAEEIANLSRLHKGMAFNMGELAKRLEGVEKAMRGNAGDTERKSD